MTRLEKSEDLKRDIRKDPVSEIGISTWTMAQEALRSGDIKQAEKLMDHCFSGMKEVHDMIVLTTGEWLEYIVEHLGEDHVEKLWGKMVPNLRPIIKALSSIEPIERVYAFAETFRSHCGGPSGLGELAVHEEVDRFVITHSPCGSGGRLRQMGRFGVTKKSYQWSWNKKGVPHYCTHCCLFWELTGTEVCGYPLRIHENVDKPLDPCVQYIYKEPSLIPDRYFERIGMNKDNTKFR